MNILDFLIRILSAATWHLSAIRSRRQCERDHQEAERRMGELLRETERAKGGQPHQKKPTGNITLPVEPTLAELGITKNESSKAQKLAALPEEDFQAVRDGIKRLNEVRVELVLKLEPLLKAKAAKKRASTEGRPSKLPQNSAPVSKPIETRQELTRAAHLAAIHKLPEATWAEAVAVESPSLTI
jgi:hypothetical protein